MEEIKSAVEMFGKLPTTMQWMALVIFAAKLVTPMTPSRHKNPAINGVLKLLNVMALNVGKDKNADDSTRY